MVATEMHKGVPIGTADECPPWGATIGRQRSVRKQLLPCGVAIASKANQASLVPFIRNSCRTAWGRLRTITRDSFQSRANPVCNWRLSARSGHFKVPPPGFFTFGSGCRKASANWYSITVRIVLVHCQRIHRRNREKVHTMLGADSLYYPGSAGNPGV
jgi:hypothetical protein